MTVSSPDVIEIKFDRLIDDMRLLRSQMIAFNRQLNGIEAYLKPSEPSEQQPESKSRLWFTAVARATAVLCFIWEHDPTTGLRFCALIEGTA